MLLEDKKSDEFQVVVKDVEDLNEVVEIKIVIEYKTNVKKNYNGVLAVMLIENASEIKLNKNGMNIKAGEEYSRVSVSQHIQKNWKKRKKNLLLLTQELIILIEIIHWQVIESDWTKSAAGLDINNMNNISH